MSSCSWWAWVGVRAGLWEGKTQIKERQWVIRHWEEQCFFPNPSCVL